MRAAIYARYSSNLQSEASIEDQNAVCEARAKREEWTIVDRYADYAMSGATMERPGLKSMIESARSGGFDILLLESLDRLSRDQEDIAGLFKRLTAWQIKIVTLSEGEINELHVGLKGTMNALFLKDLAAKSLRGQLGKARAGLAAGGIPYGYEVVREVGPDGDYERGRRRIVPEQAEIVKRIYKEFSAGRSALAVAKGLNADGVPSPRGGTWNPSTIYGHRGRGVGILHNPLYAGLQVFNRHSFVRDPDTGARKARLKDASEWVETSVPELAIVSEDLWQRVQERIAASPNKAPERHRRPKRLLSGLITCGVCGGQITIANRDRYGCAGARQKGTCTNKRTMSATEIERRVLGGLREILMEPELIKLFIEEYHAELKRLQADKLRKTRAAVKERGGIERQIARLVDAIADGAVTSIGAVGDKLKTLEDRLSNLAAAPEVENQVVEMHPNAANLYKDKVTDLQAALTADDLTREQATTALRGLVDKVVALPAETRGQFELELHGHLAQALNMAMHGNGGGGGVRQHSVRSCPLPSVFPYLAFVYQQFFPLCVH